MKKEFNKPSIDRKRSIYGNKDNRRFEGSNRMRRPYVPSAGDNDTNIESSNVARKSYSPRFSDNMDFSRQNQYDKFRNDERRQRIDMVKNNMSSNERRSDNNHRRNNDGFLYSGRKDRSTNYSNNRRSDSFSNKKVVSLKLDNDSCKPTRMTKFSVGYDLFNNGDTIIPAESCATIKTGVRITSMPFGVEGQIRPRSSTISKHNLLVIFGTIDPDYRGEIEISVRNLSNVEYIAKSGDRFAQLCFSQYLSPEISLCNEEEKVRGEEGFGSTGV